MGTILHYYTTYYTYYNIQLYIRIHNNNTIAMPILDIKVNDNTKWFCSDPQRQ